MTIKEKDLIVKEVLGDMVDTCENCEEKLGVWTTNPFLLDVFEKVEHQFLCGECHHELMMDT
jgi:uncharacterized protein YlaI